LKTGIEGGTMMAARWNWCIGVAAVLALVFGGYRGALAQTSTMQPIPAAECQQFATQTQGATGFAMKASEDDFTDLSDNSDGRSCHISGNASGQAFASANELVAKVAKVFADWREDPARSDDGPDGAEKGLVNGNRIATIEVNWEPGPGVTCSDKEPLSACKILPQQKLWNLIVDIVVKGGK
jgi:hypothetical protein